MKDKKKLAQSLFAVGILVGSKTFNQVYQNEPIVPLLSNFVWQTLSLTAVSALYPFPGNDNNSDLLGQIGAILQLIAFNLYETILPDTTNLHLLACLLSGFITLILRGSALLTKYGHALTEAANDKSLHQPAAEQEDEGNIVSS